VRSWRSAEPAKSIISSAGALGGIYSLKLQGRHPCCFAAGVSCGNLPIAYYLLTFEKGGHWELDWDEVAYEQTGCPKKWRAVF